jgi:3'-phosphoadenosine 5'-phosphosulfate sulfotransferase (PAPS reductase)/FAD synthetase
MIKIVVPISGGKDSQACLKLALQTYLADEILGLFCDTKFEHPLTYAHIAKISAMYAVKIETVNNGSVEQQCLKHNRFPGGGARFCTEELKINTSKKFYDELAEKQGGFEVWYGMRSGESFERSNRYQDKVKDDVYLPHEVISKYPQYLGKKGVSFKLPILDWSFDDVLDFLAGEENPLYGFGFDRVGCFPCLAAGESHKRRAFNFDETGRKHLMIVQDLRAKGVGIRQKNQDDMFSGCALCAI